MTIAIGDDVIDVLVHGPNRYFDNYRADPIPGVRDVYPFGYCARISWWEVLTTLPAFGAMNEAPWKPPSSSTAERHRRPAGHRRAAMTSGSAQR
jgi:hypothetical protein